MEGSFHTQTIRKVEGALLGYISRASNGACRGGSATITQTSLPWHITYEGFRGTLPRITELIVLLRNVNFRDTVLGVNCGYGRPEDNARGIVNVESGGGISGLTPETNIALQKLSGGIFCPNTAGFAGNPGSVTLLGTTTRVSIRLI
jgi:hypothetical protein